jgi:hypothetical protein
MSTLRNIWADLVEKRLWPIALLLLAGLVAVPVVLARSGGEAASGSDAPNAVAIASGSQAGDPEIVTLDVAPKARRHDGRGRDPFVQPKGSTPEKAQALESSTTGEPAGGPAASAAPSDEAKPVKQAPAKAKPRGPSYTADLRFGQADSMRTLRNVARLTPLPSADSPFFVFLGVKSGGKTLVFMVSSDAKATGDGKCRPSKSACETIELQAGDTEFFDLTTDEGLEQYQMDVISIEKVGSKASAKKSARSASGRASKAQRRLLRKVLAGRASHLMGSYRWSADRGVLLHVPDWAPEANAPPAAQTPPAPAG